MYAPSPPINVTTSETVLEMNFKAIATGNPGIHFVKTSTNPTGCFVGTVTADKSNPTNAGKNLPVMTVAAAPTGTVHITSTDVNVIIDSTAKKITFPLHAIGGVNYHKLAILKTMFSVDLGYQFEIYQVDGSTVASAIDMDYTYKLKVSQGATLVDTYTFIAEILGDINGDGVINGSDATLLKRNVINPTVYPFAKVHATISGNINKDAQINGSDFTLLKRNVINPTVYPIIAPSEFLFDPTL